MSALRTVFALETKRPPVSASGPNTLPLRLRTCSVHRANRRVRYLEVSRHQWSGSGAACSKAKRRRLHKELGRACVTWRNALLEKHERLQDEQTGWLPQISKSGAAIRRRVYQMVAKATLAWIRLERYGR